MSGRFQENYQNQPNLGFQTDPNNASGQQRGSRGAAKPPEYHFTAYINQAEETDLRHFFSADNPKNSRSLLVSPSPLKGETIEKYFRNEDDVDTIKQTFLEVPKLYTFDQVYAPNRFDHLIDQIGRTASQCTQEGHKSCLFMLFGTQQYNKNYDFNRIFHKFFGAESPLTRILFQSLSQSVELTANLMIEDLKSDLLTTDIFEAIDGYEEKIAKRITSMTDLEYQLELLKENLVRISEKFKIQYIDKLAHLGLTFRSDQGTEVKFVIFPIFDRNLLQNSDKIKEWRKFKKVVLEGEQNTFGARNHANKGSSEGREGQRGAKKAQNSEKSCYIEFVKSGLETARKVNFVLILDSDHDNFKDNIPILNEISRMSQELKIRLKNDYIQKSGSKQPPAANHHSTPSLKTPEGFGMSRTTGLGQNSGLGQNPAFSGFLGGGGIDSSVSNYANLLVRNIDNFVNDTNLFINENHQQKDFFKNRQKQVGYFEKKLDGIEKGIAGVEGAPHPQNSLLKNQLIDSQLKLRKLKNKLEYVYRSSEAKRKGLNSASPGLEQPRNGSFRNLGKGSFFGPERQNQPFGDLSGVDKASSPYVAFSRRRFSSEKKLLSPFHRTGAGEVFDARRASENAPASIKALNGLNGAPGGHIYAQNQPLFGPQNQRNFRTYGVPGAAGGYTMGPYGHNMGFGGPRVPGSHRKQFLHNSAIMPDRGDPGYTNLKDELQEFKDAVIEQFQELRNTKKSKKSKKSKTGYFASPGKNSIKIHQSYAADGTSTPKKSQNHKKSLQNFFNKRYASYNNIKENDPENRLNRPPYSPESDDEHPNQESFDTDYKIKKSSKNVKNMATNLLAFAQHSIRRHDKHKLVNIKRLKKENKRMKGSIKELKKMLQEKDKALQEMKQNEIRSEIKHDQQSQQLTALKTANSALESEVKILTEKLENLKENAKIEKNAKNEKKLKWTTLKENYEDLIEELKEAINEVNNEKLVLEAKCAENERIAEQKTELGNRLNSEVLKLREDIEEFQTQAIDIQDLSSQIQNKNVELTIKMDALKEQNEELVERCEELAADKDQLSNEFYAYKAMVEDSEDKDLQEKVQEVGALRGELEQVRLQLQAEGIKGKDLEGMVEMLKEQLEDQDELAAKGEEVGRQLGEAQNRVRELEEELEEVAGLRDLEQQKLVAIERDNQILKSQIETFEERIEATATEIQKKHENMNQIEEHYEELTKERDELAIKNEELTSDMAEIEKIQKEEWSRLENRVESTLLELKGIRSENEILEKDVINLKLQNEALIEKNQDLKTKYKNKRVENGHLKERCMKLGSEVVRLEALNQEALSYFNQKESMEVQNRKKMKAIQELKGMIGVYRSRQGQGDFRFS